MNVRVYGRVRKWKSLGVGNIALYAVVLAWLAFISATALRGQEALAR